MLNFDNVESLVEYMFDNVNEENPVSVVANEDLTIDVLTELLNYKNLGIGIIDIDTFEYDKEYLVSLSVCEEEHNYWHLSVEKAYNYDKELYFGTDGYVLFHEDVNSKSLIDMQNNEYIEMSGHDLFVIDADYEYEDEDECEDDDQCTDLNNDTQSSESTYINRSKDGTPIGFVKTLVNNKNGVLCYTSYSQCSNDIELLRNAAIDFGIEL